MECPLCRDSGSSRRAFRIARASDESYGDIKDSRKEERGPAEGRGPANIIGAGPDGEVRQQSNFSSAERRQDLFAVTDGGAGKPMPMPPRRPGVVGPVSPIAMR